MEKLKVLGIIPARGGSKGVKKKNVRFLAGRPLICHTISSALNAKMLDRVIVTTDDKEIADIARGCGAEIPFMRAKEFAEDDIPLVPDVARNTVKCLLDKEGYKPDVIVVLQPTTPLRKSENIDLAVDKLIKTKSDWVATVSPVSQHPFRMRKLDGDKLIPLIDDERIFKQRQDLPRVYIFNGAIYATWYDVIMQEDVFNNKDWRGIVISEEEGMDIDTELDFLIVEKIKECMR